MLIELVSEKVFVNIPLTQGFTVSLRKDDDFKGKVKYMLYLYLGDDTYGLYESGNYDEVKKAYKAVLEAMKEGKDFISLSGER